MTLPSTGSISMSQVNTELARTSTNTISLNESAVRILAQIPSGTISLNSLHGKSNNYSGTLTVGHIGPWDTGVSDFHQDYGLGDANRAYSGSSSFGSISPSTWRGSNILALYREDLDDALNEMYAQSMYLVMSGTWAATDITSIVIGSTTYNISSRYSFSTSGGNSVWTWFAGPSVSSPTIYNAIPTSGSVSVTLNV